MSEDVFTLEQLLVVRTEGLRPILGFATGNCLLLQATRAAAQVIAELTPSEVC
jgi:hypothetical protein